MFVSALIYFHIIYKLSCYCFFLAHFLLSLYIVHAWQQYVIIGGRWYTVYQKKKKTMSEWGDMPIQGQLF
jgi:hypothetical protein